MPDGLSLDRRHFLVVGAATVGVVACGPTEEASPPPGAAIGASYRAADGRRRRRRSGEAFCGWPRRARRRGWTRRL